MSGVVERVVCELSVFFYLYVCEVCVVWVYYFVYEFLVVVGVAVYGGVHCFFLLVLWFVWRCLIFVGKFIV